MATVYAIADLHLGHVKLASVRGFASVKEHDDAIVAAWNRVVSKRDVVYVLGDLFKLDRVPELAGTKKLVLGNHDQKPVVEYAKLFSKVAACFEFDGCLLTHIPVHPSQKARYELNVHGHTHAKHIDDPWYVPVSLEHCLRYEPLPLRQLLAKARGGLT
jgi:calcineurin-like phosphoesterase family protein